LILDEFQEVVDIDRTLPRLMRSVFQEQPEVSHLYLGSRRHMMQRIFNDENEPFWRSAKQTELGVIPEQPFARYIARQFARTDRHIDAEAVARVLAITHGHPYATQELCYFLWQHTGESEHAGVEAVTTALDEVLNSEHAHFTLVWERASAHQRMLLRALAGAPGHPLTAAYRRAHALPGTSGVQRALEALERDELIARASGKAWIVEPFLADWVLRNDA
ncbi:MAG TPA: hypothetical protein VED41_00425, partial [Solirubrobacteraceae bacterium]|nr:hypothetical protein [Solirubrobacteraceae bacterium]